MGGYLFTGKYKVGDEVVIIKPSRYPEAHLQLGDFGIIAEVDKDGYFVQKKGDPKNIGCYKRECHLDFSDVTKRQPVKRARIPPPPRTRRWNG